MEYPKHLHKNDGSGVYVVVANEYDAAAVEAIGYGKPTVAPVSNSYQEIPLHVALEEAKFWRERSIPSETLDAAALDADHGGAWEPDGSMEPEPVEPVAPKKRGRPAKVKD